MSTADDRAASSAHSELVATLAARVRGGVDGSRRRRAEYSSDASSYRVVPEAVVWPQDTDDLLAVVETCRELRSPVTMRGGGTSIAGNAVGPGVVVDTSRHLRRVLELDPVARTAVVEPGVILDDLQRAAAAHGLRFGPDPATHARCTLGGMIGNDACGARAIAYGRTSHNVLALDVVDGTATARTLSRDLDAVPGLRALVDRHAPTIRDELGRFGRQLSGYELQHLLPDHEDAAKALVGSEGTCAVVRSATVRLVTQPAATALAVLGYPDMASAADAAPGLLPHAPLAVEGIDARLVTAVRTRLRSDVVDTLPPGGGWLLVEAGGSTPAEAMAHAQLLVDAAGTRHQLVVPAGAHATRLWQIREDGAGLAGRTADGVPTWPGWEDAAVPPERLGAYLRDFDALLDAHSLHAMPYGHLGEGCVHVRLDLPLAQHPTRLRPFLIDAADLVVAHGGSLSGEHGDGRARSELLPRMYSADALAAFAEFKRCFDPDGLLNPGVLVDPAPVDRDLRRPQAPALVPLGGFAYPDDGGDFTTAVHRCVGLGACRADTTERGGFMCPSYLATRDEKDSTRGRARVLQELAVGGGVTRRHGGPLTPQGWSDPGVHESLDLCLACKACDRDCPAGVDMATYKSEVLHQTYRRRLRPLHHYVLGQLPRWLRLGSRAPRIVNALLGRSALRRAAFRAVGLDPRRDAPRLAERPLRRVRERPAARPAAGAHPVLLWADTFTEHLDPTIALAAARVLAEAGYQVTAPQRTACCGLPWITTGQLDGARRQLRRLLGVLAPAAGSGAPIVGLEPSCVGVLRGDLVALLPDDPRSAVVAAATRTLAEALTDAPNAEWSPRRLDGVEVVAQPHCHQHAEMGFDADRHLLERAGAQVRVLSGCCGLAGSFGMQRGHYDTSVKVAQHSLLPALADAPEAILLADGFSCRTQAAELAGRHGIALAQLLTDPPQ